MAPSRSRNGVKEALDGDEGDLAGGSTFEGKVSLLTEIENVVAPSIHCDDPPSTGEGVGVHARSGAQPVFASSRGKQTVAQAQVRDIFRPAAGHDFTPIASKVNSQVPGQGPRSASRRSSLGHQLIGTLSALG